MWVQVGDYGAANEVLAQMKDLPMVEDVGGWRITPVAPDDASEGTPDFALLSDPLGRWGTEVDRPRIIEGALPAPDSLDEVLLTGPAADALGLSVGDTLGVQTFSPEDIEALATEAFPGLNGPRVELTVVGVGTWPEDLNTREQNRSMGGLVSPAFDAAHLDDTRGNDIGGWPVSARVRLVDGAEAPALADAIRTIAGEAEVLVEEAEEEVVPAIQSAIDVLTVAIRVFAVIAGAAGLVVIAQAASRQAGTHSAACASLAALGLPRSARAATIFLPLAVAAAGGVLIGAQLSVLASPLLPVGLARQAEPDPGIEADASVLMWGSFLVLVLVLVSMLVASWRGSALGRAARGDGRRSLAATRLARAGVRPEPVAGVRFAYESGASRTAVPARAAIVGGVLAVAGVVSVSVVAVSLSALVDAPDRWGWTWSSRPDVEGEAEPAIAAVEADDRIESVAAMDYAAVEIDDTQLTGFAVESLKGSINFALLEGRAPTDPSEIALGRKTLLDQGLDVGDRVSLVSQDRSTDVSLSIVGVVATPMVESSDPGRGAVLTTDGLDLVRQSDGSRSLLLRYESGVDAGALEADLVESAGLGFPIYARPDAPGEVTNLEQVQGVTALLAAFFVLLGVVGVMHALMVSVRRRRPDLGVLRVLGFRRRQVRRVVAWQGATIAITGALIGIPLGLVLGRAVWQSLVGDMGVVTDPSQPWLVIALVLPASVVVALAAAWLPARSALRVTPAMAVRAE